VQNPGHRGLESAFEVEDLVVRLDTMDDQRLVDTFGKLTLAEKYFELKLRLGIGQFVEAAFPDSHHLGQCQPPFQLVELLAMTVVVGDEPGMKPHRIKPSGRKGLHFVGGKEILDEKVTFSGRIQVGVDIDIRHDVAIRCG